MAHLMELQQFDVVFQARTRSRGGGWKAGTGVVIECCGWWSGSIHCGVFCLWQGPGRRVAAEGGARVCICGVGREKHGSVGCCRRAADFLDSLPQRSIL